MPSTAILWLRRDLRLHDHPALTAALAAADHVIPVYVLDPALLQGRFASANRAWFLRETLVELSAAFAERGAGMRILHGRAAEVLPAFARETGAHGVHLTRDATPYGRARDRQVAEALGAIGVTTHAKRGLYVHEPDEVATQDGRPYSVYGAFRRAWEARPRRAVLPAPERIPGAPGWAQPQHADKIPDLGAPTADIGNLVTPGEGAARERLARWVASRRIDTYNDDRNRLDLDGTSRISQDLRFGLLSPVEVVEAAVGAGEGRRVFVNEVVWREFYAHVLWHNPRVLREAFQAAFRDLPYRDDEQQLQAWAEGRTGYPVVDAAMRQLRGAGFVHNRARMIAASFLTKHLLMDWRVGERIFMEHLVDGDVASNNGGWQWTASTGTDPQPYFRVFNPILQGQRFDPDGDYVRRWVPELRGIAGSAVHTPWELDATAQRTAGVRIGVDYPAPIVDHAMARERALATYGQTKARAAGS